MFFYSNYCFFMKAPIGFLDDEMRSSDKRVILRKHSATSIHKQPTTIAKKYVLYSGDVTVRADRRILSILFVISLFLQLRVYQVHQVVWPGWIAKSQSFICQQLVEIRCTTSQSYNKLLQPVVLRTTSGCFTEGICVLTISIVQDNLSYNLQVNVNTSTPICWRQTYYSVLTNAGFDYFWYCSN